MINILIIIVFTSIMILLYQVFLKKHIIGAKYNLSRYKTKTYLIPSSIIHHYRFIFPEKKDKIYLKIIIFLIYVLIPIIINSSFSKINISLLEYYLYSIGIGITLLGILYQYYRFKLEKDLVKIKKNLITNYIESQKNYIKAINNTIEKISINKRSKLEIKKSLIEFQETYKSRELLKMFGSEIYVALYTDRVYQANLEDSIENSNQYHIKKKEKEKDLVSKAIVSASMGIFTTIIYILSQNALDYIANSMAIKKALHVKINTPITTISTIAITLFTIVFTFKITIFSKNNVY